MFAWMAAIVFLIWPCKVPNIDDAPWEDVPMFKGLLIFITTATAKLIQPELFAITQLFTGGESNLSDFELIYMAPDEAVLYFVIEAIALPFMSMNSLMWVACFWWAYA